MDKEETDFQSVDELLARASGSQDTVAFVLIRTDPGMTASVAVELASFAVKPDLGDEEVNIVRWTCQVISGPYQVIAAVRAPDYTTVAKWVRLIHAEVPGVRDSEMQVVVGSHYSSKGFRKAHNGWP